MLLNGLGAADFSNARLAIKPSILTNKPGWSPAPSIVAPTNVSVPSHTGTLIKSNLFDRYKSRSNPNVSIPVNQAYVNAAVDTLNNTPPSTSPTVTQSPPVTNTSPLVIPPPYSGGGGGGSATSDNPTDTAQQPPAVTGLAGIWSNLSTTGKLAIVGGGIVIIYYGYKMFKGGRTATAPKSI